MLFVIVGGLGLASKGIFAKLLFAQGVDIDTVVTLRALMAMPGFVLVGAMFGALGSIRSASPRAWLLAMTGGFICYYIGARLNFFALSLIDAGVERAIIFSYPALVVIANSLINRRLPSGRILLALLITWLGILLVVGLLDKDLLDQNLLGSIVVLICAATMAFYLIVTERVTRQISSAAFTSIAMTTAALCFAIQFALNGEAADFSLSGRAWALMGGIVIFATVVPLFCMAEGVRRIGAQRAAVVSTVGPPATIVMAAAVLGERMGLTQIIGVVGIVAGILILELQRRAPPPGPEI